MIFDESTLALMTAILNSLLTRATTTGKCLALFFFPFIITYVAAIPYILDGLEKRTGVRYRSIAVLATSFLLHARADYLVWKRNTYPWLGMFLSMVLCGVQWIVMEAVLGLKHRGAQQWLPINVQGDGAEKREVSVGTSEGVDEPVTTVN